MNPRSRMTERAVIQRDANAGVEESPGYEAAPAFGDYLTDVPCRFWSEVGRGEFATPDRDAVLEDFRMMVTHDIDVTESDQVASVATRDGTEVHPGPLDIKQIIRRREHQLLLLREVR